MKFKRLKLFGLMGLSFALTGTTLQYKPIESKIEAITEEVENAIFEEADAILQKKYQNEDFTISNLVEDVRDEVSNEVPLSDEEIQKVSDETIHSVYLNLEEDTKIEIDKLALENPDMELIYKMLKGEEYNFEDYSFETPVFTDNEVSQIVNNGIKKCAATMAISGSVLGSLFSIGSGALSASWVPFVGWAVAAVLIIAMVVVIAINWDTIKRCFDELKNYLMGIFGRIASLISSVFDRAKSENQKIVYFPYNVNSFNPYNLFKNGPFSSNGNGLIYKWQIPTNKKITVFEWDEGKNESGGQHYHIITNPDGKTHSDHRYPGERIPEPYASQYF